MEEPLDLNQRLAACLSYCANTGTLPSAVYCALGPYHYEATISPRHGPAQIGCWMITIPELVAEALGSFLMSETKSRFGRSHARLAEAIPFAAKLTMECIGNSDAPYHNVEHTMLVTLAGHDILMGRQMFRAT